MNLLVNHKVVISDHHNKMKDTVSFCYWQWELNAGPQVPAKAQASSPSW